GADRLTWLAVAALVMLFPWARFRFAAGSSGAGRRARRKAVDESALAASPSLGAAPPPSPLPGAVPSFGPRTSWMQFLHQTRIETLGALRGVPFQIMLFAGLLNIFGAVTSLDDLYGTKVYPVTNLMLRAVASSFAMFIFLIITFYSGDLVWRERNLRMSELFDALPVRTWVAWGSKLAALVGMLGTMLAVVMLACIGLQAS